MKIDLTNQTAVVSGSGQGIGLAIAKGLAECGASVVLNGRSEERVALALSRLRGAVPGAEVNGVAADLGTAGGVDTLVSAVPRTDILVNNLGIFDPRPFLEIDDDEWDRFFQVNVMSGVRLSRAYLPGMLEADSGRIVFVSSESALQIPPEMIHYGMTKTAQLAVSRGLAEMCAGTGVTVNAILSGPTASEGVSEFVSKLDPDPDPDKSPQELVDEFVRQHRPTSILRRAATPEEVANLVVYTCSPQASATTGAALSVDGGTRRSIV
ncbi:MAG: SDR family oxidoreductase [Actinomycetales bacterium]|nr:SDR family oxidoreductase [Actinomycetales bacterium]